METIGAFEIKTHLPALLDRIATGEKIRITRHGIPLAVLMPVAKAEAKLSSEEIVEGMRILRKRVKPGRANLEKMVDQVRRF